MRKFQRASRQSLHHAALFTAGACVAALLLGWTFRAQTVPRGVILAYAKSRHPHPVFWAQDQDVGLPQIDMPQAMKDKQQKALRKYRFNQMKLHGQELAKLADSLQKDLEKSNENILSLQIVDKAQKIEKLAKKIQDEAKLGT